MPAIDTTEALRYAIEHAPKSCDLAIEFAKIIAEIDDDEWRKRAVDALQLLLTMIGAEAETSIDPFLCAECRAKLVANGLRNIAAVTRSADSS